MAATYRAGYMAAMHLNAGWHARPDSNGDPLTYTLDFGDGGSAADAMPSTATPQPRSTR